MDPSVCPASLLGLCEKENQKMDLEAFCLLLSTVPVCCACLHWADDDDDDDGINDNNGKHLSNSDFYARSSPW